MTPPSQRTNRRGRHRLPLLLAFTAGLWTALAVAAEPPYLLVERADGAILFRISLATVDTWILRWNHSVTGIEVSDHYAFEKGSMVLTSSHMPAFDAGLGHIPGRGTLESDGEGGYWVRDIDEPVPGNAYWLRVGSSAVDHRIVHGRHTYSLSAVAAGERVAIRVAGP